MTDMIDCSRCNGLGTRNGLTLCDECGGRGEVAQRQQRMLTSPPAQRFYRGALINTTRKGKRQ